MPPEVALDYGWPDEIAPVQLFHAAAVVGSRHHAIASRRAPLNVTPFRMLALIVPVPVNPNEPPVPINSVPYSFRALGRKRYAARPAIRTAIREPIGSGIRRVNNEAALNARGYG